MELADFKTGDLLMFKGKSWVSKILNVAIKSEWTHSALVWRNPPGQPIGLYCIDSNITEKDYGVQLTLVEDYVRTYDGEVYHLPIITPHLKRFEALEKIYAKTQDRLYDFSPISIIRNVGRSWFSCHVRQKERFFCSAYIAFVYEKLNLIAPGVDWTIIQPRDLVETTGYLKWRDCAFAPITLIPKP